MYSPIKADRLSCGGVLLRHIVVEKGDCCLSKFANQLMAKDPQQRPTLFEWPRLSTSSFSDVGSVFRDSGKEVPRPRKDIVEVDGESMKPPDANRPRHE